MILASYDYVGKYVKADGEFYTLMLFSVTGMMLLASTSELITIYISFELTSIPLYVMAGLIRASERSAEAAVKFVLLSYCRKLERPMISMIFVSRYEESYFMMFVNPWGPMTFVIRLE